LPCIYDDDYIVKKLPGFGRPHNIHGVDFLVLILAWMRPCGSFMALQLIFGIRRSLAHTYLQLVCRMIIKTLKEDPLSKIPVHSQENLDRYWSHIAQRHPTLQNMWRI
jgi:hypothetical protein